MEVPGTVAAQTLRDEFQPIDLTKRGRSELAAGVTLLTHFQNCHQGLE